MLLNIRHLAAAAALLAATASLTADNIRWLSTDYDFGAFREAEGKRSGSVQFVNEGTEPTIITRVKPTCGCTVAEYTEGEIAPGDTATVSFTYNPAGRPGRFEKHIKVYTGENEDLTSVTIRGTVIGAPNTLAREYPVVAGALRLSTDSIAMGHLKRGSARNEFLHGYNQSADTLSLSWKALPKGLSLGVSSHRIAPGDIFTLSVYLNSAELETPGLNDLTVPLTVAQADGSNASVDLNVRVYADPDMSRLSKKQLAEAPGIILYPTVVEIGTVKGSDKPKKVQVNVTNEGKSTLKIARVYSTSPAVKVKSMPSRIKPGKEFKITVEVTPEKIPGDLFSLPVEVISNDPYHPSVTFRIVGNRK